MERRTPVHLAWGVYALYGVAPNIRLRSLGKPEVAGLNPAVPTTYYLDFTFFSNFFATVSKSSPNAVSLVVLLRT